MAEKSLYERLGGAFAIAAVVNRFSDEVVKNQVAGQGSKNPDLNEWHTKQLGRLPGLKFMRTLWVISVSGGPMAYTGTKPGKNQMSLEKAHFDLHISPDEFDAVAGELVKAMDFYHVPEKEKSEVVAAFMAHKNEVNEGFFAQKKP